MDDALVVGGAERARDLPGDPRRAIDREGARPHRVGERPSLDVLEHEEVKSSPRSAYDRGMIRSAVAHPRFTEKTSLARARRARETIGVAAAVLSLSLLAGCGLDAEEGTGAGAASASAGGGGSTGGACPVDRNARDDVPEPPIHTPRWAFEPWISKDISDGADTRAFVQGFLDRDIPVGAVVLDSPWETHYNTFVPNPDRYPAFEDMVSELHDKGVRVVLWMTQFVNSASFDLEEGGDVYPGASPNFEEGLACGFFVEEGAVFGWWKGSGASVDFFHPAAVAWWHRQQDAVLDAGIDGWKLDFGDSYVRLDTVRTAAGEVPHQEYSEAYYRDFLAYGVHRRGPEFVTMVRAYDESYDFEGRFYARPEHAPVAWMGDNRRDWVGLADALDHMFRSAEAGYAVVGSDIGGYLDRDDKDLAGPIIPHDPVVVARWTAMAALTPFMQLHGRANLAPWTVADDGGKTVELYRYWSKLHRELVPFFYSLAEEAHAGGPMIVRPIGDVSDWAGDYRYQLGDALLVAPILDATGERDVALPAGARWYDWWAPAADPIEGGQAIFAYDAKDLAKIPLFVRAGAIVPAEVTDATTGLGTAASAGKLTVLVYPDDAKTTFRLHDEDGALTTIEAVSAGGGATVALSRALRPVVLRVRADEAIAAVTIDGKAAAAHATREAFDKAESGWLFDPDVRAVWVKLPAGPDERVVELAPGPPPP